MIFRQLFDLESSSWTYLVAARAGGEALIIDPVIGLTDMYVELLGQLDLELALAIDTHTHADHITALGGLRERTGCELVMGEFTQASCVTRRVRDGEIIACDGLRLEAIYTPGHTDESFSFRLADRVFTGDVLLYRGTGRTDFQGGDAHKSWDSIVNKLFRLPDDTLVYAGHDYKGWTVSTIGEEKRFNPRLAGRTQAGYVELMNNLHLPRPTMMDVAVPANLVCGTGKTP
ncbi:MAG: MBL fold metallo-hydrolase [Gammaproteobacteria bacterium]|nr:MBL fold metallo-hydrolase [Gammaproteobacteria bacterium]